MMEQSAVDLIAQDVGFIKWLVTAIMIIFCLLLAGVIFVVIFLIKFSKRENFKYRAESLFNKGDLETVIKLTSERVTKYPNDVWARWYLGKAYFQKKEWKKALQEFTVLLDKSPSWREGYLDPYIEEIKENLRNTKPEIVKK